jgi:ABC-2 type transport system permease protein
VKKDLRHFFELLWGMTEKELRARYKHTMFGFFWLLVNPLLQMVVIGFIFTFFVKEPVPNYYFYLFIGLLVWNFFSLSLTKTTPSIVYERALIKKSAFPRAVIPIAIVLSNLIHFILGMLLYAVPLIGFGLFSISRLPYIFLGLFLLIVFTVGLSLLTSALNVRFRDINFFVQAILIIWFYATPIVYPLSFVPYRYYWFWRINPLTGIAQLFQYGFVGAAAPGPLMLTANGVLIILVTTLGVWVFTRAGRNFDDWV